MENYFFELPIYRCSREKYHEELEKIRLKINESISYVEGQEKLIEEIKFRRHARQSYDFEYNEVIGWVKLYILGNQIRGKYYFEVNPSNREEDKKRFNKGIRKKQFEEFGKAFEISYSIENTSLEIYSELINEVEYLMKHEEPFKGRFIDTTKLENLAEFINWKRLLIGLNPYKN